MTDEFSLLCAIADSPGENVPRLMYADFLDEFHPDRAVLAKHIRAAASNPLKTEECAQWSELQKLFTIRGGSGLDAWVHTFGLGDWNQGLPYRLQTFLGTGSYWLDVGPTIVRRAPISEVKVVDKEPLFFRLGDTDRQYYWFRHSLATAVGGRQESAILPDCIFAYLSGYLRKTASITIYSSVILANDALSKACIAWARATDPTKPRESSDVRPSAPVLSESHAG